MPEAPGEAGTVKGTAAGAGTDRAGAGKGSAAAGLLGWPTLAFMTMAATGSIAQLSASAEYGLGAITFYLLPAFFFLLPVALVAAELATGWGGGVFVWVREGLGERTGFQAIWLQWIQSVALYPSLLAFAAASLAFAIGQPQLAANGLYTAVVILVIFWGATLVALRGLASAAKVGSFGLVIGTIIPAASLIVLMAIWLITGETSRTPLKASDIVPGFSGIGSIVLIVSTFIAFAGMEVNAVHVRRMKDPRRNYPKAIALAASLILVMYMFGSIAISVAVPNQALDLNAGAAQAFILFTEGLGFPGVGNLLAGLLAIGALAAATMWVAGPSRGLFLVGRDGYLPPLFQRTNAAGVQAPILIGQGLIVTVLAVLFTLTPSVSSAFWILQAMTAILYMSMYILLFVSAIRLRTLQPDVERGFRVPALKLIGCVGALAAAAAILIGLVPPSQFGSVAKPEYAGILLAGVLLLAVPPQIIYRIRRPSWVQEHEDLSA